MINMTRNKIPKAMHKYSNQDGPTRQSVQIDSASENEKNKQNYGPKRLHSWYEA